MLKIFDPFRDLNTMTTVIRLLLAFIVGTVIGLERSSKNKSAGFRTHTLVCLGAAVAAMTGIFLYTELKLPADISRIGSSVVSGLGFIGAGTIVVTRSQKVKGITTAAGLWTTGVIGLAAGAGFYEAVIICLILVLLVETLFNDLRENIKHAPQFDVMLRYYNRNQLDDILRFCKDSGLAISNLQISGNTPLEGETVYSAVISLRGGSDTENRVTVEKINGMEGVIFAEIL